VLPLCFADFWGRRAEFEPLRQAIRSWDVTFDSPAIDFRPELSKITARTVVITGRHDFICGPVWAGMLHEGITGSRLVTLEHSGHFGQVEEPAAFLDAVRWLLPTAFPEEVRATFRRGDSAGVRRMATSEVARARAAGDRAAEVEALYALARLALRGDDLPRAEELAQEALEVAVRSGDRGLEERPRHVLAAVARLSGDHVEARTRYLASIALNEALGQACSASPRAPSLPPARSPTPTMPESWREFVWPPSPTWARTGSRSPTPPVRSSIRSRRSAWSGPPDAVSGSGASGSGRLPFHLHRSM
jgi:hypothetical protein